MQGESIGINIGNNKGYIEKNTKYSGYTSISGHIGELFINILNDSTEITVGLSVGLGVSAAIEVDIGGMVNTVVDGVETVWDGAGNLWNSLERLWS